MPLTTAGRNHIAQALLGEAVDAFDNTYAYLGVGDSNTAFAQAQTDLVAATNKLRNGMEATYPQRSTNELTFRALFATDEANWAWEEWAIFNAAAAGTMLNRKAESLGTKADTQSWQLTVTITVTNADEV